MRTADSPGESGFSDVQGKSYIDETISDPSRECVWRVGYLADSVQLENEINLLIQRAAARILLFEEN